MDKIVILPHVQADRYKKDNKNESGTNQKAGQHLYLKNRSD